MHYPDEKSQTLSCVIFIGTSNYFQETFLSNLCKKEKYNRWNNIGHGLCISVRSRNFDVSREFPECRKSQTTYFTANNVTKESLYRELGTQKESLNGNGERPIRLLVLAQRRLLPVYKLRVHELCYTTTG